MHVVKYTLTQFEKSNTKYYRDVELDLGDPGGQKRRCFFLKRASPQKTLTLEVTDLIFCHDQAILVLDFFFHNKTKKEPHNIAVTQFWVVP